MTISIGEAIFIAVKPIIKLILAAAGGAIFGRIGILDPPATRTISSILINWFLPNIIFSKVVTSLDISEIGTIGILALTSLIFLCVGLAFGLIVQTFTPIPRAWKYGVVAAGIFNNASDLPMAYVLTLANGPPFSSGDVDLGVAYCAIFLAVTSMAVFNFGGQQLIKKDFSNPPKNLKVPNESKIYLFQRIKQFNSLKTKFKKFFFSILKKKNHLSNSQKSSIYIKNPLNNFITRESIHQTKNDDLFHYSSTNPHHKLSISSAPPNIINIHQKTIDPSSLYHEKFSPTESSGSINQTTQFDYNDYDDNNDNNDNNGEIIGSPLKKFLTNISQRSITRDIDNTLFSLQPLPATIYNSMYSLYDSVPNHQDFNNASSYCSDKITTANSETIVNDKKPSTNINISKKKMKAFSNYKYFTYLGKKRKNNFLPSQHKIQSSSISNNITIKPQTSAQKLIWRKSSLSSNNRQFTYPPLRNKLKKKIFFSRIRKTPANNNVNEVCLQSHSSEKQKHIQEDQIENDNQSQIRTNNFEDLESQYGFTHKMSVKLRLKLIKQILLSFCQPPSLALILSVAIAISPPLKRLFVQTSFPMPNAPDGDPPLEFIMDLANFVGGASVPTGMLLLGANIGRLKVSFSLSAKDNNDYLPTSFYISAVVLAVLKLVVLPIVALAWVYKLQDVGLIDPNNLILTFVIVITSGVPCATVQMLLTTYFSPATGPRIAVNCVATNLLLQYSLMLITLPILMTYTLMNVAQ